NFDEMSRAAEASPAWGSPSEPPSIEPEAPEPKSAPSPSFEAAEESMSAPSEPAWSVPPPPPPPAMSTGNGTELTEEQIDRIARRVVQLMSDQVVRNIAWEVIPDLAEMVVKERIRQLESES
ncbi:MAG TPA: hypothetical protein VFL80_09730, partial [Thermoanaerobaculia bacterium]|nr:hypothetical protein [Thermoanaerobaculia bacterium]